MDTYTRLLMIRALRNSDNAKAYALTSPTERTPENLPDELGIRHYSSAVPSPYQLPSASGEDVGIGSIDINRDRVSLQRDGKIGNGTYYAEINRPFNGDLNARLRYLLPHKNGYFEADGNLKPGNSSINVNYTTNF